MTPILTHRGNFAVILAAILGSALPVSGRRSRSSWKKPFGPAGSIESAHEWIWQAP